MRLGAGYGVHDVLLRQKGLGVPVANPSTYKSQESRRGSVGKIVASRARGNCDLQVERSAQFVTRRSSKFSEIVESPVRGAVFPAPQADF